MSKHTAAPPLPFEPEFVEGLRQVFEQRIPFNQVIGLKLVEMAADHVVGRVDMRPELVGHFSYNRLHGGVISATLDAMGGMAVMAAIGARHMTSRPRAGWSASSSSAPSTCASTICAKASATSSPRTPKCCAWARAWPARAWSFAAPMAR